MNVLPPALLVLGLGIAVLGFAPRAAGGTAYGVVAISLFCRLLGSIDGWTHWLVLVSVFDAMSLLPAEPFSIWGSAVLAGTGVALCVVGAIGFRRLDRSVG